MTPPWTDRRVVVAAAAAAVAVAAAAFWLLRAGEVEDVSPLAPPPIVEGPELLELKVFYPGEDGRLHAKIRELPPSAEPTETIARLVDELLAGPHGEHAGASGDPGTPAGASAGRSEDGLWPPFPPGVTLGRAYLMDDATVILDLVSADGKQPSTGSREELLMLYSLVDTVLLNVDGAERLVLLWNGGQPTTFAGHVDTTRPLTAKPELIASGGGG